MLNRTTKVFAAAALALALAACSKVPAGHVGIKVFLLGGEKGVDTQELGVGRYWIGINEDLFLFPTFTQTYTWEKEEALSFQNKDGLNVSAAVGITYHVDPSKVTSVFQKYRKGVDEITATYLRNMVRDALVKRASRLNIETIYGEGKSTLIEDVQRDVIAQTAEIGIVVEKLYWIGGLGLPPTVTASINSKIEATQKSAQRENEIAQTEAEAKKEVAQAEGTAKARLAIAEAEAKAISVKGQALRANPEIIEFEKIAKWNGTLPQVTGGATPFINLAK